jgi:hypothetical protein
MEIIEIGGIIISTAGIIFAGLWFMGKKSFEGGTFVNHVESSLTSINESIQKMDKRIEKQEESIQKIPLIELRLTSIEENSKKQDASIQKLTESIQTQGASIQKLEESNKKLEESMSKLPCAQHEKDYSAVKGTTDTLTILYGKLKDTTIDIANWVMKQDGSMIESLSGKISPRTLTEAGKGLLEMSSGQTMIDNNLDFFIGEIREFNPKTAYDVEKLSMKVLLSNTDETCFNSIKDFIYYAPEEIEIAGSKIKIELNTVIHVMSLHLRDKYLTKYPFEKPTVEIKF